MAATALESAVEAVVVVEAVVAMVAEMEAPEVEALEMVEGSPAKAEKTLLGSKLRFQAECSSIFSFCYLRPAHFLASSSNSKPLDMTGLRNTESRLYKIGVY